MTRRHWGWLMATALLTILVVMSAPAFPAEQDQSAAPPGAATDDDGTSSEAVETILREQEELLRGQRFTYDPGGRRDPFRSLYESVRLKGDKRPEGIHGMLVSEVNLTGIVRDPSGDIALLMGSDNKGYFLRVGDSVFDGEVIAVDSRLGAVTFRQRIDDPRRIKPYRDVVKRLVPLEDEESADE